MKTEIQKELLNKLRTIDWEYSNEIILECSDCTVIIIVHSSYFMFTGTEFMGHHEILRSVHRRIVEQIDIIDEECNPINNDEIEKMIKQIIEK